MFNNIVHKFRIVNEIKVNCAVCFSVCNRLKKEEISNRALGNKGKLNLGVETNALLSIFPEVHDEILNEQLIYHKTYPDIRERYSQLLNYTLNLDEKYLSRAIFFVRAYKLLEKPSHLTEENLRKAYVLGWCHKLIDASIVLDDDIADGSDIRYNKPTWYKLKDVGVDKAILDAAFLESGANFLILNHFISHPQYANILRAVLRTYSYTNVAQIVEVTKYKLEELHKFQDFVKFYFFTVPLVSSALYLANIDNQEVHLAATETCVEIARFQKIEDDVTCVFSPMFDTEKACTDISEGRASWLVIEAYKRGSKAQKNVLEQHYGKNNQQSVEEVYNIFKDLRLKEVYDDFKEEFYEKTYSKINKDLPKMLPAQLFIDLLDYAMSGRYRI